MLKKIFPFLIMLIFIPGIILAANPVATGNQPVASGTHRNRRANTDLIKKSQTTPGGQNSTTATPPQTAQATGSSGGTTQYVKPADSTTSTQAPAPAAAKPLQPVASTDGLSKIVISNIIKDPEKNLGANQANRKYQCSVLEVDLKGQDFTLIGNTGNIVLDRIKAVGLTTVDDLDAFKKLKPEQWPQAVVKSIIALARGDGTDCNATLSEPYKMTEATADKNNDTKPEADKCTADDKTISVALNNYPGGISNHEDYYKKWNEKNWRCSIYKIPVSKPKEGIAANRDEIEKYLKAQVQGAVFVQNKAEFDKLKPDDQKKAVVFSALKCICQGPNSINYTGLTFKDKNVAEPRTDTSFKENSGITISDTNPNAVSPDQAPEAIDPKFATSNFKPAEGKNKCITISGQMICFYDDAILKDFKAGKLNDVISLTAQIITSNKSKFKSSDATTRLVVMTSTDNSISPAMTCPTTGGDCGKIAQDVLGSDAAKIDTVMLVEPLSQSLQINKLTMVNLLNHEWAHDYDIHSPEGVESSSEPRTLLSMNTKYEFGSFFAKNSNIAKQIGSSALVKTAVNNQQSIGFNDSFLNPNQTKYPECVFIDPVYINSYDPSHNSVGHDGHPWDGSSELFASMFETYANSVLKSHLSTYYSQNKIPQDCQNEINKLVNEFNKFLK